MRHVPKALVRLGLPAVAALALAGCGDPAAPAPGVPASPAPASASALPSTGSTVPATTGPATSDGLTVRYLGDDGSVRTLRVEDFPR